MAMSLFVFALLFVTNQSLPLDEIRGLCNDCYNGMRSNYAISQFWWQQANEWTAIATMFELFQKEANPPRITNQFDAMPNFKANCYNDDGLWWVLAYYQLYELATTIKNTSLAQKASTNFQNSLTSIMDSNSKNSASKICSNLGVIWCNTDTGCKTCNCGCPYKNAITNELFLDALGKAKKTFSSFYTQTCVGKYGYNFDDTLSWFVTQSKMIQSNHQIRDGLDHTSCAPSGGVYTYNQGVILTSLVESGKYNDVLTGILQESYNQYTADKKDGFGRIWTANGCTDGNPGDGSIFDAVFIRYLSDIMPQLSNINKNLADQWTAVIQNSANKLRLNNQTGANQLFPCPIQYLQINASTNLNVNKKYNVWIQSSTSNQLFLAMNNKGSVYNYNGNPVTANDQGNPGWVLETTNNGESFCIYNPYIDGQTNHNFAYLSAHTLGGSCNQNIWNGNANYGNVIDGAGSCLRDEMFYIESVGNGVYSIRCSKCNLSPDISNQYHPMYVGQYNGGPGYNTKVSGDEQFILYSQDNKQRINNLQVIKQQDIAQNQLTQYSTLEFFLAALKVT